MATILIALLLGAAQAQLPVGPGAEALALGRRLAETGTLAGLLPVVAGRETQELVAAHPELGEADKAALRATAAETARAGLERALAAIGNAYAASLSLADLRVLVVFNEGEAAKRYRAAQPTVLTATMQALAGMDFKKDTMAAFCARTGRGCGGSK